jgi:hypothetical protein
MTSAICTLFEGDYHHGVAALANSLATWGFEGTLWVGFRGELPDWMASAAGGSLAVGSKMDLRLIPLSTNAHLTNYKPQFMLDLWQNHCSNVEALLYLDPDICLDVPWASFHHSLNHGIFLCEDVGSPLSRYHPRRHGWARFLSQQNIALSPKMDVYVNGGCLGVQRQYESFLRLWLKTQQLVDEELGGSDQSKLGGGTSDLMRNPLNCLNASDQDALNIACELWNIPEVLCIGGRSWMGFEPGVCSLPHALGSPKPWNKSYLRSALQGNAPTTADKAFWSYAQGPLQTFPPSLIHSRRRTISWASLIGRFYHRR